MDRCRSLSVWSSPAMPGVLKLKDELKNSAPGPFFAPCGGLDPLISVDCIVEGVGACGLKALITIGEGAEEVRYRVGRAPVPALLRAEDIGERGDGGTMCDTKPFTPTPASEFRLWLCWFDAIMVKFRRIWLPKLLCRLFVDWCADERAEEALRAAVGPVVMCGELAMSCKMPEIRDTISCKCNITSK